MIFKKINNLKSDNHYSDTFIKLSKYIVVFWFLLLTIAYFIYIKKQYIDLFFESEFLHINFLRDISQNKLTAKGFFTVFGEHLFPGYNLVLALNYYFFDVWGGFDNIIFALSLVMTSAVVGVAIYRSPIHNSIFKTLIALITLLLLLSTTNNPQWGMALAAAIGVTLFVFSSFLLATALDENAKHINPFFYIAMAFQILFFLGGYAIGAVAAIFLLLIIWVAHNRTINFKIISVLVAVFVSLIIYVAIVSHYSVLFGNKPTGNTFSFQLVGQFILIMTGASLLGKAFFEQTHQFWPYYLCGALLLFWSVFLFKEFIQRPVKGRLFILAMATYSLVNVFTVSLFRFKNGLDGAMGQWYNVHTHFIAVAVCFYLLASVGEKITKVSVAKGLSIAVIIAFAAIGYSSNWKKSAAVPAWKQQFAAQAPVLLAFPDLILDKNKPFNTMLWSYAEAKSGIEFLYNKNLWIFRGKLPLVSGLSNDGWLEANKTVMIVCPVGSKTLSFWSSRPDGWPKAVVSATFEGRRDLVAINNGNIKLEFTAGRKPAIILEGNDYGKSNTFMSNGDDRKLIAKISDILCAEQSVKVSQNRSLSAKSLKDLEVINWGPQSAIIGSIPNKQPDGSIGLWIKVSSTEGLMDAQVIFDGKPAKTTSIQNKLITAAIDPEQIKVSGEKNIYLKQAKTGELFFIGVFNVDVK